MRYATLFIFLLAPSICDASRAVMEGTPASSNTIFVDTVNARVGVGGINSPTVTFAAGGPILSTGPTAQFLGLNGGTNTGGILIPDANGINLFGTNGAGTGNSNLMLQSFGGNTCLNGVKGSACNEPFMVHGAIVSTDTGNTIWAVSAIVGSGVSMFSIDPNGGSIIGTDGTLAANQKPLLLNEFSGGIGAGGVTISSNATPQGSLDVYGNTLLRGQVSVNRTIVSGSAVSVTPSSTYGILVTQSGPFDNTLDLDAPGNQLILSGDSGMGRWTAIEQRGDGVIVSNNGGTVIAPSGGVGGLRMDRSGDVGINVSTANATLQVLSDAVANGFALSISSQNGNSMLTVYGNGNFGIGVTTVTDPGGYGGIATNTGGPVYFEQSGTPSQYASLGTAGGVSYLETAGATNSLVLLPASNTTRINTTGGTQIYRCSGGTATISGVFLYGNTGVAQTACTVGAGTLVATGIFVP